MQNQINSDDEDDDLDLPPVPFLNRERSHEEDDLNVSLNLFKDLPLIKIDKRDKVIRKKF